MEEVLGALLLAASLATGGNSAAACEGSLPRGPRGLPAPVAVHTTCGGFVLRPNGRVVRALMTRDWPSWAPAGSWRARPDTYVSARFGLIRIVRDGRAIWRSSRRYKFTSSIAVGRDAIAFALFDRGGNRLFVSRLDGRERFILRGEDPLAFTREGLLLTQHWNKNRVIVRLRRVDGSLARMVAPHARTVTFDERTNTLFYITRKQMVASFDGERRVGLARVPRGWTWSWLSALGNGRIALVGEQGLAVIRSRGGVEASTRLALPTRRRERHTMSGDLQLSDDRRVAFTSTWRAHRAAIGGEALVSVLRPGQRHATVVFHHHVDSFGCGWWTRLAWHGEWLLYSTSATQRLTAIDTASRRRVDLTTFVRALPGRSQPPLNTKIAFWADWRRARGSN